MGGVRGDGEGESGGSGERARGVLSVRVVLRRVFLHYYYYWARRDMLRALGVLPHARGGGGREPGSDASGSDSDGSDDEWLRAGVLDAGD